jgi:hypothetical protein
MVVHVRQFVELYPETMRFHGDAFLLTKLRSKTKDAGAALRRWLYVGPGNQRSCKMSRKPMLPTETDSLSGFFGSLAQANMLGFRP